MTNIDHGSLMQEAGRLEAQGQLNDSARLYEQVAGSNSEHAAYAETCLNRIRQNRSITVADSPTTEAAASEGRKLVPSGLGGSSSTVIGVGGILLAMAIGLGKATRHGGANVVHGIGNAPGLARQFDRLPGGVPRPGQEVLAPAAIKEITRKRLGLDSTAEHLGKEKMPGAGEGSPNASEAAKQHIEITDVDVPGLLNDAKDLIDKRELTAEEVRALYEQFGLTLHMGSTYCREEYQGPLGEQLDLFAEETDYELAIGIGDVLLERHKSDTSLPNRTQGEYDRCRVHFGSDGRPFLSMSARSVDKNGVVTDSQYSYELRLLDGTEADFRNGEPVRLCFSDEGLEQNKQDCIEVAERTLGAYLRMLWEGPEGRGDLVPRAKLTMTFDNFPNSAIIATPSRVLVEEQGPSAGTLRVTFPRN